MELIVFVSVLTIIKYNNLMFGGKKSGPKLNFTPEIERSFNLTENFSTLCVNKCLRDDI